MTTTAPCKIVILIWYVKMYHWDGSMYAKKKFEDAKRGNQNAKRKRTKGQIMIPKTLHRKLIMFHPFGAPGFNPPFAVFSDLRAP